MEVKLRKILPFIALISLCFGGRLSLVRDKKNYIPPAPYRENLTLKLITEDGIETMPVRKFQNLSLLSS